MASRNLSFRTPEPLMDKIRSRDLKGVDNPGAVAKRDVERWYNVLQEGLAEVRLTPPESVVLIHYVGPFEGHVVHTNVLLAAQHIQSGPMGLGEPFAAVRESLAAKMAQWSLAGRYAAWDAAERYQVLVARNFAREDLAEDLTFGMALHHVGLHTYDLPQEELSVIEGMDAVEASRLPGAYVRAREALHDE